jgi:hypothetical protein
MPPLYWPCALILQGSWRKELAMARRVKSPKKSKARGRSRVARTAKKLIKRLRPAEVARPPQREPDVPLDVLNRTYTPTQTSLKASFRSTGDDRQRDQEFGEGYADERWHDEDHFTNKSGDPRIGTHRRKYEPGE